MPDNNPFIESHKSKLYGAGENPAVRFNYSSEGGTLIASRLVEGLPPFAHPDRRKNHLHKKTLVITAPQISNQCSTYLFQRTALAPYDIVDIENSAIQEKIDDLLDAGFKIYQEVNGKLHPIETSSELDFNTDFNPNFLDVLEVNSMSLDDTYIVDSKEIESWIRPNACSGVPLEVLTACNNSIADCEKYLIHTGNELVLNSCSWNPDTAYLSRFAAHITLFIHPNELPESAIGIIDDLIATVPSQKLSLKIDDECQSLHGSIEPYLSQYPSIQYNKVYSDEKHTIFHDTALSQQDVNGLNRARHLILTNAEVDALDFKNTDFSYLKTLHIREMSISLEVLETILSSAHELNAFVWASEDISLHPDKKAAEKLLEILPQSLVELTIINQHLGSEGPFDPSQLPNLRTLVCLNTNQALACALIKSNRQTLESLRTDCNFETTVLMPKLTDFYIENHHSWYFLSELNPEITSLHLSSVFLEINGDPEFLQRVKTLELSNLELPSTRELIIFLSKFPRLEDLSVSQVSFKENAPFNVMPIYLKCLKLKKLPLDIFEAFLSAFIRSGSTARCLQFESITLIKETTKALLSQFPTIKPMFAKSFRYTGELCPVDKEGKQLTIFQVYPNRVFSTEELLSPEVPSFTCEKQYDAYLDNLKRERLRIITKLNLGESNNAALSKLLENQPLIRLFIRADFFSKVLLKSRDLYEALRKSPKILYLSNKLLHGDLPPTLIHRLQYIDLCFSVISLNNLKVLISGARDSNLKVNLDGCIVVGDQSEVNDFIYRNYMRILGRHRQPNILIDPIKKLRDLCETYEDDEVRQLLKKYCDLSFSHSGVSLEKEFENINFGTPSQAKTPRSEKETSTSNREGITKEKETEKSASGESSGSQAFSHEIEASTSSSEDITEEKETEQSASGESSGSQAFSHERESSTSNREGITKEKETEKSASGESSGSQAPSSKSDSPPPDFNRERPHEAAYVKNNVTDKLIKSVERYASKNKLPLEADISSGICNAMAHEYKRIADEDTINWDDYLEKIIGWYQDKNTDEKQINNLYLAVIKYQVACEQDKSMCATTNLFHAFGLFEIKEFIFFIKNPWHCIAIHKLNEGKYRLLNSNQSSCKTIELSEEAVIEEIYRTMGRAIIVCHENEAALPELPFGDNLPQLESFLQDGGLLCLFLAEEPKKILQLKDTIKNLSDSTCANMLNHSYLSGFPGWAVGIYKYQPETLSLLEEIQIKLGLNTFVVTLNSTIEDQSLENKDEIKTTLISINSRYPYEWIDLLLNSSALKDHAVEQPEQNSNLESSQESSAHEVQQALENADLLNTDQQPEFTESDINKLAESLSRAAIYTLESPLLTQANLKLRSSKPNNPFLLPASPCYMNLQEFHDSLMQQAYKSCLLKVSNTEQAEDYIYYLSRDIEKRYNKPVFIVHAANDLTMTNGLHVDEDNQCFIGNAPLKAFLDKTQGRGVLVIDYSPDNFTPQEIILNNTLLDERPHIGGIKLPEGTLCIGIAKPRTYNGADFKSRFAITLDVPSELLATNTLSEETMLSNQNGASQSFGVGMSNEVVIDLCEDPIKWQARLLGKVDVQGKDIRFTPSQFIEAVRSGKSVKLKIQNPPKNSKEFTQFIKTIMYLGRVSIFGTEYFLEPGSIIFFEQKANWKELSQSVTQVAENHLFIADYLLNPSFLPFYFNRFTVDEGCVFSSAGLLEQNRENSIKVHVTRNITISEWLELLTEAQHWRCHLELSLAPGIELPHPLQSFLGDYIPISQSFVAHTADVCELILSNEPEFSAKKVASESEEAIIIEASGLNSELFYQLISKQDTLEEKPLDFNKMTFSNKMQDICRLLKKGEHIILVGSISPELADTLSSVFANGQLFYLGYYDDRLVGKITIVTDQATEYLNFIKPTATHHIPLEEKLAALPQFEHELFPPEELEKLSWPQLITLANSAHLLEAEAFTAEVLTQRLYRLESQKTTIDNRIQDLSLEEMSSLAEQFYHERQSSLLTALSNKRAALIIGETGVGKSYFMQTLSQKNSRHRVYFEVNHWLENLNNNPVGYNILFLDEANLKADIDRFQILDAQEPHLIFDNKLYQLGPNDRVVFAGNPHSYGAGRQVFAYYKNIPIIEFTELTDAYLAHEVIFPTLEGLSPDDQMTVSKFFIQSYRKVQEICNDMQAISTRELKMMALILMSELHPPHLRGEPLTGSSAHQSARELALDAAYTIGINCGAKESNEFSDWFSKTFEYQPNKKIAFPEKLNNQFPLLPSRYAIYQKLKLLFKIRQLKKTCSNKASQAGGLVGLTITGLPGEGKSKFLELFVKTAGAEEVNLDSSQEEVSEAFCILPANVNQDKKLCLLDTAFHHGWIVIIDEINTIEGLEEALNAYLSGYDLKGQKANTPGFLVLGTQNSASMQGRKATPLPIKRRMFQETFTPYSAQEQFEILCHWVSPINAWELIYQYHQAYNVALQTHCTKPCFRDLIYKAKNLQDKHAQSLSEKKDSILSLYDFIMEQFENIHDNFLRRIEEVTDFQQLEESRNLLIPLYSIIEDFQRLGIAINLENCNIEVFKVNLSESIENKEMEFLEIDFLENLRKNEDLNQLAEYHKNWLNRINSLPPRTKEKMLDIFNKQIEFRFTTLWDHDSGKLINNLEKYKFRMFLEEAFALECNHKYFKNHIPNPILNPIDDYLKYFQNDFDLFIRKEASEIFTINLEKSNANSPFNSFISSLIEPDVLVTTSEIKNFLKQQLTSSQELSISKRIDFLFKFYYLRALIQVSSAPCAMTQDNETIFLDYIDEMIKTIDDIESLCQEEESLTIIFQNILSESTKLENLKKIISSSQLTDRLPAETGQPNDFKQLPVWFMKKKIGYYLASITPPKRIISLNYKHDADRLKEHAEFFRDFIGRIDSTHRYDIFNKIIKNLLSIFADRLPGHINPALNNYAENLATKNSEELEKSHYILNAYLYTLSIAREILEKCSIDKTAEIERFIGTIETSILEINDKLAHIAGNIRMEALITDLYSCLNKKSTDALFPKPIAIIYLLSSYADYVRWGGGARLWSKLDCAQACLKKLPALEIPGQKDRKLPDGIQAICAALLQCYNVHCMPERRNGITRIKWHITIEEVNNLASDLIGILTSKQSPKHRRAPEVATIYQELQESLNKFIRQQVNTSKRASYQERERDHISLFRHSPVQATGGASASSSHVLGAPGPS